MPRFDAPQIRRYYDRQTAGFVALGQGGREGAIHRAVWGPGVKNRTEAFHYVEDRLAELVGGLSPVDPAGRPRHVLDLGCGVGGSLAYLAPRVPMRGTGVTLSPVQARLATARIEAAGLADRITCLEADYTRLPATVAPADLAYAIESFVHGPSPAAFFSECARVIRPGGVLVVCDDLRRVVSDPRAEPAIEQFRNGWQVNTLLTREELVAHATAAGFGHDGSTDLTPWLELGRPRDRAIAVFVAAFGWLPLERTRAGHLVGGTALQRGLARGWIAYELAVFRRPGRIEE
jgi:SAM-dependent methyltransferase